MPSRKIFPESTSCTPAMRLRRVDLPAPLPPMTVTKSPSSSSRSYIDEGALLVDRAFVEGLADFGELQHSGPPLAHVLLEYRDAQGERDDHGGQ